MANNLSSTKGTWMHRAWLWVGGVCGFAGLVGIANYVTTANPEKIQVTVVDAKYSPPVGFSRGGGSATGDFFVVATKKNGDRERFTVSGIDVDAPQSQQKLSKMFAKGTDTTVTVQGLFSSLRTITVSP